MGLYTGMDIPCVMKATTSYTAGTVVCVDSIDTTTNEVIPVLPSSAAVPALGVIVQTTDSTMKQNPTVRIGGVADCIANAAVDPSSERRLVFDTDGKVGPMSAATGLYQIIGYALEKCGAANDIIKVHVHPATVYHT